MQKPLPPDEEGYQEAVAELLALVKRGDTSDLTWQDDLPEAPPLPEGPDETVAIFISKKKTRGRK